jgi:glutamate-1-semialdehyde aminotransferase
MDEVWTGFRLAYGGAQELYGVKPDLASYAKAMANGYPISAYVGKRQYMEALNTFRITTTYAGETLSIAAAIATLTIMKREKVHDHLSAMGKRLMDGFNRIAAELGVDAYAAGLPVSPYLKFNTQSKAYNERLEYLWFRELFREGVFVVLRWFLCYSHKPSDIDEALGKARIALKRALDAEPKERETTKPFYW